MTRLLTCALISLTTICYGQDIAVRKILTDSGDSTLLKAQSISFDKNGNYCFNVSKGDSKYFYTANGTLGPFRYIQSTFGNTGEMENTFDYSAQGNQLWYYKNGNGTQVFGPIKGAYDDYNCGFSKESIAITAKSSDSVYYHLNGKLVGVAGLKSDNLRDWCAFSDNGNSIYYVPEGKLYYLFLNNKLIDSSENSYTGLNINNNGQFLYAKGHRPEKKTNGYDYMFFLHTNDTVVGPVRTAWKHEIKENGGHYSTGDDNGPEYLFINNLLVKNLDNISNITIRNEQQGLFTSTSGKTQTITANCTTTALDFDKICCVSLNDKGEFALFGTKNYYLYKYHHNKKQSRPLSKYDARANPVYISPQGKALVYYETDDSVYVYSDDTLLMPAVSRKANFKLMQYSDLFRRHKQYEANTGDNVSYLEVDSAAYMVYNGNLLKLQFRTDEVSFGRHREIGQLVTGELTENGFYFIQKTGTNSFLVAINNTLIKEVKGPQEIISNSCVFDKHKLTFYGIEGLAFNQYTITYE